MYWRLVFRASTRERLRGVVVGALWPSADDRATLYPRLDAALALLEAYDPRVLQRLRKHADGVVILGTVGPLGSHLPAVRLIRIADYHIREEEGYPLRLAATLAHEATHAWLDALGIEHSMGRQTRIEAICYRAEARLARRVPDGADYAAECEQILALTADPETDFWSPEARLERSVGDLRELGAPDWVIRVHRWLSRRSAA